MSYAWGPEREVFSSQASYAVLNSVFDAPGIGDERNFVRLKRAGIAEQRADAVEVSEGERYEVYIYFRNDAESEALTGVRMQSNFERFVTRETDATVTAGLNANGQQMIWDTAKFVTRSSKPLQLKYVEGTAKIHSGGAVNGTLVAEIFQAPGAELGYDVLNGTLVGGKQYVGYVAYEVEAVAATAVETGAVYGDELVPYEEEVSAPEVVPEGEMPSTGTEGGIVLAILMGAVVALGWSLLRKFGIYGKIR